MNRWPPGWLAATWRFPRARRRLVCMRVAAVCCLAALGLGCSTWYVGTEEPPTPPFIDLLDPGFEPDYATDVYLAALQTASLRLRGVPPDAADVAAVQAGGREAYESIILRWVDPTQNPDLAPTLRTFFLDLFGLPDAVIDVGGSPVNHAEPANLATYLVANDLPFSGLLTAPYCVDNALNPVPCSGGTPIPAGVLSNQAYLSYYAGNVGFNWAQISTQLLSCRITPDPSDAPLVECNNCGTGNPAEVPPEDDPSDPPRLHKKYQGLGTACTRCLGVFSARRLAFAKYDTDGVYNSTFTITDLETPVDNQGICYNMPPGYSVPGTGGTELVPCCTDFSNPATCMDAATAMAQPGGCCYHEILTDYHAYESIQCGNPAALCTGLYFDEEVKSPAELGKLALQLDQADFPECMARRVLAYAIGDEVGTLGPAATAVEPAWYPAHTLEVYGTSFEDADYQLPLLLRDVFTGKEFLDSHL